MVAKWSADFEAEPSEAARLPADNRQIIPWTPYSLRDKGLFQPQAAQQVTTETTTQLQRSWQRGDTAVDNVNCPLRLAICSLQNHVRRKRHTRCLLDRAKALTS